MQSSAQVDGVYLRLEPWKILCLGSVGNTKNPPPQLLPKIKTPTSLKFGLLQHLFHGYLSHSPVLLQPITCTLKKKE